MAPAQQRSILLRPQQPQQVLKQEEKQGMVSFFSCIGFVLFIGAVAWSGYCFGHSQEKIVVIGPYGGAHEQDNPMRKRNLIEGSVFLAIAVIILVVAVVAHHRLRKTHQKIIYIS